MAPNRQIATTRYGVQDTRTSLGTWSVSHGVNHGSRNSQATQAPINGNASRGNGGAGSVSSCLPFSLFPCLPVSVSPCPLERGRNSSAVNAGLNVSELNADSSVETAIVSANWRKNCPVMPLMNAHG